MIPDWKLERYLTGDLPDSEMREIREMEATDEIFAGRVKMMREDNRAILKKMPFERLSERLDAMPARSGNGLKGAGSNGAGNGVSFTLVKFATAAALVLAVVTVALFSQREIAVPAQSGAQVMDVAMADAVPAGDEGDTRIKGLEARIEVWKKTADSAVQMSNLDEAREGDEIQLRYSVPQKCFGLLFSMDGNGAITMHMGDGDKAIALEPGKMVTLPYAYKLDNAPQFEKFFFLVSDSLFSIDVNNIDAVLKQKGVEVKSLTLRKAGEAQ